ncbi:hypothetical protein G4228_016614 [Cervus hanglu yarkandensis]|nr:hypothetical protein G4228_016614 [Cervus hanglu yarkandensis]
METGERARLIIILILQLILRVRRNRQQRCRRVLCRRPLFPREEEAKFGARRLARSLQKLGFQVIFTDFKVVNVLAVCNMPFEIRLPEFTKNNRPHASYEPELHPAVCYRIKSLRATLQIFSTGSITVTGPNVKAVATAVEQIYPFVFESRKEIL